eukprot:TRINITY_DN38446_c0_g1_i1.p1 TRINITY_DN38446_c0_g1~~TRINITY_DN38446_c0_g1_i1.p1  ORF type:complete len:1112 (-),score=207.67 TRINITY_DN38446_c0_g1_i1:149-3484(-)
MTLAEERRHHQYDEEEDEDDVFQIPAKNPKPEALRRWRRAVLFLNAARRFRYTMKLKDSPKTSGEMQPLYPEMPRSPRSPVSKFRSTGHAVVALHRMKQARTHHELHSSSKRSSDVFDDAAAQAERATLIGRGEFAVSLETLLELSETDSEMSAAEKIAAAGGVGGLAHGLRTIPETGIADSSPEQLTLRREIYGENRYPEKPAKPFLEFLWEACQDTTLIILAICAVVSLVAEETQDASSGWYEGVGIGVAVIAVILVTAISDYRQSLQFRNLDREKANIQLHVLRGGRRLPVSIHDIVVGDVVPLAIGDQVPADGVLIVGHSLVIDESSMTGEADPRHKDPKDPFLFSGCKVADGYGTYLVTGVGINTEWGRVMSTLSEDTDAETPLQVRLNGAATLIGKAGLTVAGLVLVILLIRYWTSYSPRSTGTVVNDMVAIFAIAVTIVVVAVPEGLPLAVTLTLAYSMKKMMQDKALVRVLAACETMGSATTICSDKTGTLTLNQMTVVKTWQGGFLKDAVKGSDMGMARSQGHRGEGGEAEGTHYSLRELLFEGVAQNSDCSVFLPPDGSPAEVSGSPTESAIITWVIESGMSFEGERKRSEIVLVEAFNSSKKRAGVVIKDKSGHEESMRVHWKGAAEIIVEKCTHWSKEDGQVEAMGLRERSELNDAIATMAAHSLRCIGIAYRPLLGNDAPTKEELDVERWKFPETDLILLAIVGIKDPCRPGVPEAVARCQRAGVKVRMVTGDNILTAKAIARECGILTPEGVAMEGKDFRVLSEEEMIRVIPTIDVLARSSPTDKHTLVKMLRQMGEVVAVTGDGTNDAPALHEADIGLAMGISGTEVAKESSDIIILDDNFASIVKVVRWGRSVYANIQKFLQFQLTVNVVALVTNFVAACSGGDVPLTAVQLLWVNLIMDTLGALALATEAPTDSLLDQAPVGRRSPLISNVMWRNLFFVSAYQLVVTLTMNYAGKSLFNLKGDADYVNKLNGTLIFNAFVFMQLFNEINCRKLTEINVFSGVLTNSIFMAVVGLSVVFQVIIVEFLNDFASTKKLNWSQWLITIALGAVVMPVSVLVKKFVPVSEYPPYTSYLPKLKWGKWKKRNEGTERDSTE